RRPGAACRHCSRACDGAASSAFRRGHVGTGSRAGWRGTGGHSQAHGRGHDDGRGDARDGLRARGCHRRHIHGRWCRRRTRTYRPHAQPRYQPAPRAVLASLSPLDARPNEGKDPMIPPKDEVTVCFAHVAYNLQTRFAQRGTGIRSFQAWNRDELDARVGEADVLVISGLWRNDLIEKANRLRFIQSIGAGTDQFGRDALSARGIRLASASGVNMRAVSEHAMALILALARRLPEARDNQTQRHWRGMIGDLTRREDELGGETLLIVGLGNIGGRLARLAKAFDMRVIGLRRDPAAGAGAADSVHSMAALGSLLPEADFVALTCPLTPETEKLIDAEALARMKRSAYLVNIARGRVVD